VALFLLGLYLFAHRARLRRVDAGDAAHVAFKGLLMPALTFAAAWALVRLGALEPLEARTLCILSAMPAAITTFSMAHEHGVGAWGDACRRRVARSAASPRGWPPSPPSRWRTGTASAPRAWAARASPPRTGRRSPSPPQCGPRAGSVEALSRRRTRLRRARR